MANARSDFEKIESWSLSELAVVVTEPIDKWKGDIANAEIARRVAQAQIDAAFYMKWSLIFVAGTATITAIATLGMWLWPHLLQ